MKKSKVLKMSLTALFTAMIFILTRFVSVPVALGYVHFGDAFVFIVASAFGGPYAVIAAVIGEALADVSYGMIYYVPATIIIKLIMALLFVIVYKKSDKILTPLTVGISVICGVINVLGYFIADLIIDKSYAVINLLGNGIQGIGSVVIFIVVALAFDNGNIKKKLFLNGDIDNG